MRVVLDTSVLVSALIASRGTVGKVLQFLRDDRYLAVYSKSTLIEFLEVLHRPKIQEKYHIRSQDISALLKLIVLRGVPVKTTSTIRICRDPKDDKFLEAAVDGRADFIVTGDSDLLDLGSFQGVEILNPAAFVAMIERKIME